MSDDDMEDYGFEYSDDEEENSDVDIENQYYNSKGSLEEENWEEALKGFQRVLSLEEEASGKGEWGFKALKQIVKLHHKTGRTEELLTAYEQMLGYIHGSVTKNHAEKKVNSTLDHLSSSTDTSFLQRLYEATLAAVLRAGNDRLWFKTNVKLAHLWVQREDWGKLARVLRDLRKWCMGEDGGEDPRKGTQLLEVYALEIQMHSEQGNKKALREIYTSALGVKSAIPHPRIMGVVRECGGKMHMRERAWADAATAFFEAFKSYDEAGHPRRLQCLKYLVLATMLNASGVDPFDAQEARPYKSDPEVVAMTGLVAAYQDNRIDHFERLLRQHRREIMGDAFIAGYVQDLLRALRTQVLMKLLGPYRRVKVDFICKELNITPDDAEGLLVTLIHEGQIQGRIDQADGVLKLDPPGGDGASDPMYDALHRWADSLSGLQRAIVDKLS